ncbi:MAG: metal ABC transporter solute-binding protein, Zn/Mn family [Acidimicrobiia bacterium]
MRRLVMGVTTLAAALAGCGGGAAGGDGTVTVVASFHPLAEAAARVGGDDVQVTNLTPAGTEPHDLELTPAQVDAVEDADVVLYLGGGFQPAVERVVERRGGAVDLLGELPVVEGAAGGDDHAGADEHAAAGAVDPHFWLDPTLLAQAVTVIERVLAEAEPSARSAIEARGEAYRTELQRLDDEMRAGLADCGRRDIVVSHAAFHYLAERYDLVQVPVAGLSPEVEPNPARLAELTDLIGDRGVTTVFYEALVGPAVAETLAREAGVVTAVFDPIEGLSRADADAGTDYATIMRRNLAALRRALECR